MLGNRDKLNSPWRLLLASLLLANLAILILRVPSLVAQDDAAESSPPELLKLTGEVIDVRLSEGQLLGLMEVMKVTEGKTPGSLKSIGIRPTGGKRQKTIAGVKIEEIIVDNQPLDVIYDKKQRALIHSPEKRAARIKRTREISERLASFRDRLWPPLTDQQQEEFLKGQHEFLEKVKTEMSRVSFREVETEFFLVLTDMPPKEVDGYLAYLDAMYRELCKAFGLSDRRNIWCGKCVVVAFAKEIDYLRFEATIMENPNAEGSQGICHSYGNGEVKFAGYRGEGDYFGSVLIHETAHGFVHRYLSSARLPSWLNEGSSDWIAHAIMKSKHVPQKQLASARFVKRQGGWGDVLTTERISFDHYGTASALVDILLAKDKGGQFRKFFKSIKEGQDPEESLKETFGMSYQDLKILYAQRIARIK